MKAKFIRPLIFAFFCWTSLPLYGWDFPERPSAVALMPVALNFAFASAGYAHTAYRANEFLHSTIDKFQVEAFGHHGLVDVLGSRLSIYYGTHMINGPVNPGDQPGAEASQWMMNAIQYEYGLQLAWYMPKTIFGTPVFLAEYSRRSYHPLRDGFENPSSDLIRSGLALMGISIPSIPSLRVDLLARFAWNDLYEFWGTSTIPDPRAAYTLFISAEGTVNLGLPGIDAFLLCMPDLIALRKGSYAVDLALQGGLRLGHGQAAMEFFLDYHHCDDTEQLVDDVSPATLFGYGIRFTIHG